MKVKDALNIIDPSTRREATRTYAGDCVLFNAKVDEACREVVAAYREMEAERDAAVHDLEELMPISWFDERCKFCKKDEGYKCPLLTGGGVCRPKWRGPQVKEAAGGMKVEIMGTAWSLDRLPAEDMPNNCDGVCDETIRRIGELDFKEDRAKAPDQLWKENTKADIDSYSQRVRRHEIIHAFMFECGLAQNSPWAHNEEMVDWFAMQWEKMSRAMYQAGALEGYHDWGGGK